MGLWQEIMLLIADLGWWQTTLILVATILTGILAGISAGYLIMRFVFKRRITFFDTFYVLFGNKPKVFIHNHLDRFNTFYVLFSNKLKVFVHNHLDRRSIKTPTSPPELHEPAKFPIPELLVEIEHNLKIITEFSGDNLLSLQSDVWDAHRYSAHRLPVNLREQLTEVYSDIHVLKQIAWFLTEFDYRSSFLNELYSERIPTIAERLQRIKQNIENGALIGHGVGTKIIRDGATIHSPSHFSRNSEIL